MGFTSYLTQTAKVRRQILSNVTGTRQPTASWSTVHPGLPCRTEELSTRLAATLLGRFPDATHRAFFTASAQDIVKLDDQLEVDGDRFAVQSVTRIKGARDIHHVEVVARRLRPEVG